MIVVKTVGAAYSHAAPFDRLLPLTGIVGNDFSAASRYSLSEFAEFFECGLGLRMVALSNLLNSPVDLVGAGCI